MEQNSKKTKKAEAEISLLNNATFPCSPTYRLTQGGCCKSHFTRTHDVKNSLFHPHCQPCWDMKLSKLLTLRNQTAQISSGLVPALFKRTYSHSKDQFPSIEGPNPRAPPVQHWNIIVPFDLSFSLTWLIFTFHKNNVLATTVFTVVGLERSHHQLPDALDVDLVITQAHFHTCVSTYKKVIIGYRTN